MQPFFIYLKPFVTMKTRLMSSVIVMLLLVSAATAGNLSAANADKPSAAAALLEKRIVYPQVAEHKVVTGTVEVELLLKENNELEIVEINSEEKVLATSLENQIKRLKKQLKKTMEPGTAQKFKFIFTL
jgi:peptidoglycan hydrolase CwlO-like protein